MTFWFTALAIATGLSLANIIEKFIDWALGMLISVAMSAQDANMSLNPDSGPGPATM